MQCGTIFFAVPVVHPIVQAKRYEDISREVLLLSSRSPGLVLFSARCGISAFPVSCGIFLSFQRGPNVVFTYLATDACYFSMIITVCRRYFFALLAVILIPVILS